MSPQISSLGADSAMQTALTAQLFQISTSSAMRTVEKSQRNADVTVVAMQKLVNELKQEIRALTSTISASQTQREQEKSTRDIESENLRRSIEECRSDIAKIKEEILFFPRKVRELEQELADQKALHEKCQLENQAIFGAITSFFAGQLIDNLQTCQRYADAVGQSAILASTTYVDERVKRIKSVLFSINEQSFIDNDRDYQRSQVLLLLSNKGLESGMITAKEYEQAWTAKRPRSENE